jgi:hypothetical protein
VISALTEGSHANEASTGVLFAGGLITGEALMGIVLAIPIAISGNTSILHFLSEVRSTPLPPTHLHFTAAADLVPWSPVDDGGLVLPLYGWEDLTPSQLPSLPIPIA